MTVYVHIRSSPCFVTSLVEFVCLLGGCLTSQQHASVSQGRICSENMTCCHTEIEVADQTFYLTQSQYADTGPTSPSVDPTIPGGWQGSHWSASFEVTGMTHPRKNPVASGIRTQDLPLPKRTPYPLSHRGGRWSSGCVCPWTATDQGSSPDFAEDLSSRWNHISDLNIGTPMATLVL